MVIIFVGGFMLHLHLGVRIVLRRSIKNLMDLHISYDEKMRRKYEWYYDFMSFIRKNTPDDATILFPPQFVWSYSNGYFLLPRRLHYGNREIFHKLKPPVYVVIYKKFPTFKVDGPRIIHDSQSGLIHYQSKSTGE
jgi:hypothetical protein